MRSGVVALVVSLLTFSVFVQARAASPAEQFVQDSADHGIGILTDKTLAKADRENQLREFLISLLDLHRMAIFTLGPVATKTSPDQVNAFVDAYIQFAIANYDSEFDAYTGQTVRVTGSIPRSDNDVVVTANIIDPASHGGPPDPVSFRVVNENGKFAVVDASVEGVWFTIAQHDDFAGFLKQNNDNVPALIARLKDMTAKLQAAGK